MSAGIEFNANVLNQLGTPAMNSNLFANLPAAGFTGRIFISTDTREIYRDTGTTWELIGSGAVSSVNIYNSNGTLTGNRTVTLNSNDLTFSDNKSSGTNFLFSNLSNTGFSALQVASNGGTSQFGRSGIGYTPYKTIIANTTFLYSGSSGNIALLSDGASGNITFAAGGSSSAQMTLTNLGRLLLGTTTDAGFLADFNGTVAIRNNLQITTGSGAIWDIGQGTTVGVRMVDGGISRIQYVTQNWTINGGTSGLNSFQHANTTSFVSNFNLQTAVDDYYTITRQFQGNVASATGIKSVLNLTSTAGSLTNANILRMLYINPAVTGWNDVRSIEVANGTSLFNNVKSIATADISNYASYSKLTETISDGANTFGAAYYTGSITQRILNLSGNNRFGTATINGGATSNFTINFTSTGTLTADQAGIRTFAGHQIFNQFGGTASGTITHFAGLQILGLYNNNTGTITPTITNAYGIVINNLNDYSHTFTLTNRWGVYQTGSNDNNYLAGKLLVGTTTVTGRQVHINGNIELTTTLAGTAGGASGDHLSIWVNGNEYKIALLNP